MPYADMFRKIDSRNASKVEMVAIRSSARPNAYRLLFLAPFPLNDRFRYANTWRGLILAHRTLNAPAKHSLHGNLRAGKVRR
jgi:hypothetical protein